MNLDTPHTVVGRTFKLDALASGYTRIVEVLACDAVPVPAAHAVPSGEPLAVAFTVGNRRYTVMVTSEVLDGTNEG
jgi:hypothetical protein